MSVQSVRRIGKYNSVLISATGNWTVPASVTPTTPVKFTIVGAGGGTPAASTSNVCAPGGSAAEGIHIQTGFVVGQNVAITIGVGAANTSGGTTSINFATQGGPNITAPGGGGSGPASATVWVNPGPGGSVATNCSVLNTAGQTAPGGLGVNPGGTVGFGAPGTVLGQYGAGANGGSNFAARAGNNGACLIEWVA